MHISHHKLLHHLRRIQDQLIAYLVNKGLDGDMDIINNQSDKIIRGKVKAMIVKINRGSVERPAMPEIPSNESILRCL